MRAAAHRSGVNLKSLRLFVGKQLADLDHDILPSLGRDAIPRTVRLPIAIGAFLGDAEYHELFVDQVDDPVFRNTCHCVERSLRVEVVTQ